MILARAEIVQFRREVQLNWVKVRVVRYFIHRKRVYVPYCISVHIYHFTLFFTFLMHTTVLQKKTLIIFQQDCLRFNNYIYRKRLYMNISVLMASNKYILKQNLMVLFATVVIIFYIAF